MLRSACSVATSVALIAATGAANFVGAQTTRQPDPNTPRILVPTLVAGEKGLGVQAADAIRSRISQDFPFKELWVISRADINGTLEASGYKADQPLNPVDAKTLASLLRADQFVDGTVKKTNGGFRIEARLVEARDKDLVQPLPPVEAARMDLAAMLLSREIQAARKASKQVTTCTNSARDGKYDVAVAAAKQAITAYPKSTLARLCLAQVMALQKMPSDSVLKMTNEVLAMDSSSRVALGLAAQAYKDGGDCSRALQAWGRLLATDASNVRLQTTFANEAAGCGKAAEALPVIEEAVRNNPGDPALIRLKFFIQLAVRDFKGATVTGEELLKTDTVVTDTLFFTRLAGAYAADSQPQKSTEILARGVAKFPTHTGLQIFYAQALKNSGQLPQALMIYRKAVEVDPKTPRGFVNIAQIMMDMKQPDSALIALRQAVASGADSAAFVAQYALSQGNTLRKFADSTKNREDFKRALMFVQLADSLAPTPNSKLLVGLVAYQIGLSAVQEAPKSKSCDLAKMAEDHFLIAQIAMPAGGQANPQAAAQILGALAQYDPFVKAQKKQFCK
jgi:tetratricopeptide (TPR) repeat protein